MHTSITIEGNTALAFFMEAKEQSSTTNPQKVKKITSFIAIHDGKEIYCRDYEAGRSLKYHQEWNWLMPVIKKFNELHEVYDHDTWMDWCENINATMSRCFNISEVYPVVIGAVKWYNSLTTK